MKKTKIVATLGPSSSDKATIKEMILKGVNVCRLNFSHGTHEQHLKSIKIIRELIEETCTHVAILGDLQGPKLRIGEIEGGSVEIKRGELLRFTSERVVGNAERVFMTYEEFPNDVKKDELILIDDGKILLKVVSTNGKDEVVAEIIHGGVLSSNKGVNLPNTKISLPSLTEKDLIDLEFALENELDWIGLSFVRNARDIIDLKYMIADKGKHAKVVAKIEKPEAIDDIDLIIKETDALMVARGDLGVEIPMQQVPMLQKALVERCRKAAKPVIIATQMMESMIHEFSPTRAEVNDVANAVLDGADALMLSGETSVGKYPIKVIESMTKIIEELEKSDKIYHKETPPQESSEDRYITNSVCYSSVRLAQRVKAKAIVTMTFSGYTALRLSSQRPKATVYVFTRNRQELNVLSLVWGVECFYYDKVVGTDHTIKDIIYLLKKEKKVKFGDFIVNTASMPIAEMGKTNMMKLTKID